MGRIIVLWLMPLLLFAVSLETFSWREGETYLMFLERMALPNTLYYQADREDQKLTEEIRSGVTCYRLDDANGSLTQLLIPVTEELQLHLFRDAQGQYRSETIPIVYDKRRESIYLQIEHSPYNDIFKKTGSKRLAHAFVTGFKNSLNFRRDLRKGDPLAMVYAQKYRLGTPFSMPELQAAVITMRGKKHGVYLHSDERYYNEKGAKVEGFLLARPVRNARVSSGFTLRRYHPILKRYRAHLGVDYAAPRGTPIIAAGDGKIVFAGRTRGYGNLIKIQHKGGYLTLYAHLKSFRRGIRNGKRVKQGQVIGYVGTTGLSTGPHLHFGLYKHGRPINPARVVQVASSQLSGKERKQFLGEKERLDRLLDEAAAQATIPEPVPDMQPCLIDAATCKARS